MNPFTLLALVFAGTGLVLAGIAIPLILRRVKPNYWYGFRTKRTLSDPKIWYEVNAYFGKRLLICGLSAAIGAAVLYRVPGLTIDGYALGMTIVALVPLVITMTQSLHYLDQLTDE
ncbi:hypothetical protein TFLX_05971 [Thermoflexales bacterium]|nr:hypothetical protein TFLX_05971 [Thermoflexales bacterium]